MLSSKQKWFLKAMARPYFILIAHLWSWPTEFYLTFILSNFSLRLGYPVHKKFLHVYSGVWVCMFHMYGWAYAHIWRSEVDVRRLLQSLSTSIHSGKVWLVLLASLPQGFCLCLCYAGITGSVMTVKFLCGWNPNFDPYSALSAAVYPAQQFIYCLKYVVSRFSYHPQ